MFSKQLPCHKWSPQYNPVCVWYRDLAAVNLGCQVTKVTAQPISTRKAQSRRRKSLQTFRHFFKFKKCRLKNKQTDCVICVSCSVHVISTYYARKRSWAFYLNYPQISEVGHVKRANLDFTHPILSFYFYSFSFLSLSKAPHHPRWYVFFSRSNIRDPLAG